MFLPAAGSLVGASPRGYTLYASSTMLRSTKPGYVDIREGVFHVGYYDWATTNVLGPIRLATVVSELAGVSFCSCLLRVISARGVMIMAKDIITMLHRKVLSNHMRSGILPLLSILCRNGMAEKRGILFV